MKGVTSCDDNIFMRITRDETSASGYPQSSLKRKAKKISKTIKKYNFIFCYSCQRRSEEEEVGGKSSMECSARDKTRKRKNLDKSYKTN